MLNIISRFLDLIFPPHESTLLVRASSPAAISALYRPGAYESVQYIVSYSEPLVQALIKENKYHHNTQAAKALALVLQRWLTEHPYQNILLVHVPLSAQRQRERGYNQVSEVLRHVSFEMNEKILKRTVHTAPQTSLARRERLSNITNAFSCDPAELAKYDHHTIILIDDVLTTGATLKAARAAIALHLPAKSTLICLALAH